MKVVHLSGTVGLVLAMTISGWAKDKPHNPVTLEAARNEPWIEVDVSITPRERGLIQDYVRHCEPKVKHGKNPKSLPPGLAKKVARGGQLPPGWQKKCVRGEIMSEGIYRQAYPLPPEVVVQLPPPPPGTILVAVSGKVVRLLQATREILDVFDVHL